MHTAKTSYMMRGSVSGGMSSKFVWSPHVIMSFQQSSSHFCNQNTFNLQDWLTFIACWSLIKNICKKIPFERSISWFQNNRKTKERHVSFKDEMWPQNKMQNGKKSITTWLTVQRPSWINYSGNICVYWAISITRHSEDVLATKWSMTSSLTDSSRLLLTNFQTRFLQLFNWNSWGPHHDITSLVWIIPPRKRWLHGI